MGSTMKLLVQFIIISLCFFNNVVFADVLSSKSKAKELCNKVMSQVAKNNIDEAFNLIKPYAAFSEAEIDTVMVDSKLRREQFLSRYGVSQSYEFINSKKVGDSLLRLLYIEKMENHVIVWNFFFYKTKKGWVLNKFNWNDQYEYLFNQDHSDSWWDW